jgi:hypothetical protein
VQISFPEQTASFVPWSCPNNNHLVALRPEPDFDLRSTFDIVDAVSEISLAGIDGFRHRFALAAVAEHPAFAATLNRNVCN